MNAFSSLATVCLLSSSIINFGNSQALVAKESFGNKGGEVRVEIENDLVTVMMQVNEGSYIGVGFGSSGMEDTYTILADDTDNVEERQLGSEGPSGAGTELPSMINVTYDSIDNGVRTVICTRDVDVGDSDYYDFSGVTTSGDTVTYIYATRSSTSFGYHGSGANNRGSGTLTFLPPTLSPSMQPTNVPTQPTYSPSLNPTEPSLVPTSVPSSQPTAPSLYPSSIPSTDPSAVPSGVPTFTNPPSYAPTEPSTVPTGVPSAEPTAMPTVQELGSVTISSADDAIYDLEATVSAFGDNTVKLELSGPDQQWYGFGFGNMIMNNTYTVIVDGNGTATQRILGYWQPGVELTGDDAVDFEYYSNTVDGDIRTVILTTDKDNLPFDVSGVYDNSIGLEYIMASSTSFSFAPHDFRAAGIVNGPSTVETTDDVIENSDVNPTDDSPETDGVMRKEAMVNVVMILSGLMVFFAMW